MGKQQAGDAGGSRQLSIVEIAISNVTDLARCQRRARKNARN